MRRIFSFLLPAIERDPKFREALRRQSLGGLATVAWVEIAAPVLLYFGSLAVSQNPAAAASRLWQTGAMVLVGTITLALSGCGWGLRHAGPIAAVSAWLAPAVLFSAELWEPIHSSGAEDYVLAAITLVVVAAAAMIPLRPWHMLALGLSVEGMYILSSWVAAYWHLPLPAHSDAHHIFLILLALLATGVAANNYDRWRAEFQASREAVRVAEALTGAQLRAQLAENAISIGKMAAALSHEINSPLGTLRSSIETLMSLNHRWEEAAPEEREKLAPTRDALRRSIEESAARIDDVAGRLRRFVALEEAELRSADLNDLLSDVTLLHAEEIHNAGVRLEFDFEKPLPPLCCRPQLLSSVFSTLLSNAIHAVNGDGRIRIETRGRDSRVEVTIRDNGRGIPPDEVNTMFDPRFKVAGHRVASGNWSLFNSRQIVYEHGGEIRVETAEGQGTAIHVTLPLLNSSIP